MPKILVWALVWMLGLAFSCQAATLTIAGIQGAGVTRQTWEMLLKEYEAKSGNSVTILPVKKKLRDTLDEFEARLAKEDPSVDLYVTDIVWLPQNAHHFVELTDVAQLGGGQHLPAAIRALTIEGHLMGLPLFMDAPALYFRKDLLDKYNKPVPVTWGEMEATARTIMDRERYAGNDALWGYVWQGQAGEGLTCNILEWVQSNGGGRIVEPDGSISINNKAAVAAVERAAAWIGTISPPETLQFGGEESRAVWNEGNAVFMRNWPYAYALSEKDKSKVKGKFGIAPLPAGDTQGAVSAAALGEWAASVSKYSKRRDAATDLAVFLSSPEAQRLRAVRYGALPTMPALYEDPEILKAQPALKRWRMILDVATPRPVSVATAKYTDLSRALYEAVHSVLEGKATAADQLKAVETKLKSLKGAAWLEGTPFLKYAELLSQGPKGSVPK